jgi:predicted amidophosphoribosyltransferase
VVTFLLFTQLPATSKLWLERGLHQILPRACSLCEQNLEGDQECAERLCSLCKDRLPGRIAKRCLRCALVHMNLAPPTACPLDAIEKFPWDAVITWADYDYPMDGWIHALKFQREAHLAFGLGWGLAQAVADASLDIQQRVHQLDMLIPLPLSPERFAKRGFNQAQLIAHSFQTRLAFSVARTEGQIRRRIKIHPNLLKRIKDGPAMSLLAAEGRQHQVKDAYSISANNLKTRDSLLAGKPPKEVSPHSVLQGLRIGLVDDVMTTGATLAEATRCLKAAGALEVIALVAARTPR